jgi:gliding motility-associated-like protein
MTTKLFQIILIAFAICFSIDIIASDSEVNSESISVSFAPFTFEVGWTNPLCYNSSDGVAWVSSITGGTPPYTYEWLTSGGTPIPGETNDTISGLSAGNYFCRITDNDGTRRTKLFKLIDPPIILFDEVIVDNITCNGYNDGAITIEAVGGTGILEYSIDGGLNYQIGSIFTDLGPGNYNIIIQDENNCLMAYDFNPVTISEPGALSITLDDFGNLTCYGSGDGYINITPGGGTLPYTYSWTGPSPFTSGLEDLVNLAAGSYSLVLTDANNCSENLAPVTLTQPDQLAIFIDNIKNITCNGDDDGAISVTVSGGTLPYTYSWTGPGSFSSNLEDISSLEPGNYTLQVTDANGCNISSAPITVAEPPLLTATLDNIINVSCSGGNNGAIYVTITGGTLPRAISWTGPSGFTSASEDITGLVAGNYNLLVTDANGCSSALGPLSVSEPLPIVIVTDSTNNISCYDGNNGSIYISVTGGTLPYNYLWTGPGLFSETNEDITGLKAGNYNLTLTDGNNCIKTYGPVTLTQPTWLSISIDNTNHISCFGDNNGSISITASGGTPPYSYLWNGPDSYSSSDEDISNLAPGAYYLTLTDNNSCSIDSFGPVNVNEPPALLVVTDNITNLSCWGTDDGAISVTVTGGTPPYSYSWTGPGAFSSITEDISGLEPGNYNLVVTDAHLCSFPLGPISITEPAEIVITTDLVTNVSCNGGNDGAISVSVTGGIAPLNFMWTGPGSFSFSGEDLTNLYAGSYNLSVSDATGCSANHGPVVISEPPALDAIIDSAINVSCNGNADGSIYVTVTGGVMPYIYDWTGPSSYSTEDITGLETGTYNLEITDANNCIYNIGPVIITEPALLSVTLDSVIDISCYGAADGAVYVTVTGGTLPYTNTWNSPGGFSSGLEDITGLDKGNYSLNVVDDHGCTVSLPVQTIDEPDSISVVVDPTSVLSLNCYGDNNGRIDITPSGGSGTYTYSWSGPTGFTSSNQDINGLRAGNYNLVITDINLCLRNFSPLVTITEPAELQISLAKTDIICFNDNNGTITVTATGGIRPYQYSRNGINYFPDSIFIGLHPAPYTIYVRDANSCITSDTVTINQPPELRIVSGSWDASQNLCFGDSNAVITITATGGNPPLEYSIDSGYVWSSSNVFTGLPAGIYYIFVRDISGCMDEYTPLSVSQPAELKISSYSQVDITTCFTNPEGQIAIEAEGGVAPLTYTIDGINPNLTGVFNNVSAGLHILKITDKNGCDKDTSVFINSPPELAIDTVYLEHITGCHGDNIGVIDIGASGGTGTLEFSMDGGSFGSSGSFINIPGGGHIITVRDGNNCITDTSVYLNQPDTIGTASISVKSVTCYGDTDGSVTVIGSGGTPPYTYTLNPGTIINSTGIFTGLTAGIYTVTVDDSHGCPSFITPGLAVIEPLPLTVDSTESENISCWGMNDGQINIYASGGFAPYQYSIDNGLTFDTLAGHSALSPSVYYTYIKDAAGCLIAGDTIVLSQPPEIIINSESAADVITCYGDSTGSIDVIASGGTGDLIYSIDGINWQNSGAFLNLPGGSYQVSVIDTIACSIKSNTLVINQPDEITAVITVVQSFNGEPGSIHISASGGTGNLEFSINGPAGPYQADTAFLNLWPGDYRIAVRDENGCLYEETVTLEAVPPLEIDVSYNSILCNGDLTGSINLVSVNGTGIVEYSIDDSSTFQTNGIYEDLPAGRYIIFVRDEDRRIYKDTVEIVQPDTILVTADIIRATCNRNTFDGSIDLSISGGTPEYTYLWSNNSSTEDLSNLEAGLYTITITDANNCIYQNGFVVMANTTIIADAGADTVVCTGDQVILEGSGIILEGSGEVNYFWQPEIRLTNPAISNPVAMVTEEISYVLIVTEPGGCYDRDTVTLNVYPLLGIDGGLDTTIARGQTIMLNATGGPFDSYSWMPETYLDDPLSQSTLLHVTQDMIYYVTGTTSSGCTETDSIIITTAGNLIIYSGFTPNDDGINDEWDIDNCQYYPNMIVEVYSRWGGLVFSSKGYSDDKRWDGKYRGKPVSVGTYWYVINLNDGSKPITGHVTIVR